MHHAKITFFVFAWVICIASGLHLQAQSVSDYAVRVSATVQTNPAKITLSWLSDSRATGYTVYRKSRDATSWGSGTSLAGTVTNHVDTSVSLGGTYEYRLVKAASAYTGYGYVYAGIQAPLVEGRGKVVVVIDQTHTDALAAELTVLEQDLAGDGWTVIRHDVPRMAVDPANTSSSVWAARSNELANLKSLIRADYNADTANVKAVLLLGHVPVPYSGNLNPDGHPDHLGAWPADVYYAEMGSIWNDTSVNSTGASDARNRNVPGDGKFDSSSLPSTVELQVGRVDFANLRTIAQTEGELLRRYLAKDHAFRHASLSVERRGLVDDHFGLLSGEVPAANGWRNFAAFFGATNTAAGDWFTVLDTQSYLWGYGCGPGTYTSIGGVGTTSDFATHDPRVVFTLFFGSYFGDWDKQDNLMRAALSTPTYTLTTGWAARPNWHMHHMGLGETIGFSARVSQNNGSTYVYNYYPQYVHVALLGDPTLRLHPVPPPQNFVANPNTSGGVDLSWSPPAESVAGYHVYRGTVAAGPFTRLNGGLLTETQYTANGVTTGIFMVRAVKLETSGSGTYWNASQGIFAEPGANSPPVASDRAAATIQDTPLHLALDKLLATASDPDGDTLTVSATSGASTNGGTVALTSSEIVFTPVPAFAGVDRFSYTITDGRDGSATANVVVFVSANGASSNLVSLVQTPDSYLVRFLGIPDLTYRLQRAPGVTGPWETIATLTAPSNGLMEYEDKQSPPGGAFYRTQAE